MPEITDAEIMEFARYRIFGTPESVGKKINDLEKDNRKQREEINGLREAVPEEGQLLISKEDGLEFRSYQELGNSADVKSRLESGSEASTKLQGLEIRTTAVSFAQAAGLAQEAVDTLIAIPDLSGAKFEVRKKKNDRDEMVGIPYLTLAGENQVAMSFEDAKEKVPVLNGLRAASLGEPEKLPSKMNFVPSGGGGGGDKGGTIYDKIRQEAENKQKTAQKQSDSRSVEDRLGMVRAG